ncbi:hypothetical protein ABH944_006228 [Caballeronia udeis]|uniref:LysR family transcriptional regulator n=1 Tax=Caballeronia udeis TaxID=1232866 RepID=A0ABW8MQY4_9BURK
MPFVQVIRGLQMSASTAAMVSEHAVRYIDWLLEGSMQASQRPSNMTNFPALPSMFAASYA